MFTQLRKLDLGVARDSVNYIRYYVDLDRGIMVLDRLVPKVRGLS